MESLINGVYGSAAEQQEIIRMSLVVVERLRDITGGDFADDNYTKATDAGSCR